MKSCYLLLAAVAALGAGCAPVAPPATVETPPAAVTPAAGPSWADFMHAYIEETFRANPTFAVSSGRHEFDGQLPDWSPAGIAADATRLRNAIAAAGAFDATRLSETERFERDYLMAEAPRHFVLH